jgi:hypothetical protein
MVKDNRRDASVLRLSDLTPCRDATIHRDDDADPLSLGGVNGFVGDAITMPVTVRREVKDAPTKARQSSCQKCRRTNPIRVVIAVNKDGFAIPKGMDDQIGGSTYTHQALWLRQILGARQQKLTGGLYARHPPTAKDFRQKR